MGLSIDVDNIGCSLVGQLIDGHLNTLPTHVLEELASSSASPFWDRIVRRYADDVKTKKAYYIVLDNLEYLKADLLRQILQHVLEIRDALLPVATTVKVLQFYLSPWKRNSANLTLMYLTMDGFSKQLVKANISTDVTQSARVIPAVQKAVAAESKTVQSIVKARQIISKAAHRTPSPEPGSKGPQTIEAHLGQLYLEMWEKAKRSKQRAVEYPFLNYAKSHWYTHTGTLDRDQEPTTWSLFFRLSESADGRFDHPWHENSNA